MAVSYFSELHRVFISIDIVFMGPSHFSRPHVAHSRILLKCFAYLLHLLI